MKRALIVSKEPYIPSKEPLLYSKTLKRRYVCEEACIPPQVIRALSSTSKSPYSMKRALILSKKPSFYLKTQRDSMCTRRHVFLRKS